jgi:hypothetical protein
VVIEIRKTSILPNIRDDAINALIGLKQGSLSYSNYTQQFNDFQIRFRQPLTDDFHCVRLMNGLANLHVRTQAKSHSSEHKGYNMPLVEL